MKVNLVHNGDDVFVAWKPKGFIPGCRGFALLRRRNGIEEVVSTWVGFRDEAHAEGERRASTDWPIQKYQWTDYMARPGDTLAYRVLPMVGPDKDNLRPAPDAASDWTRPITLSAEVSPKLEVYFNRGIVAAQWVSRRLDVTPKSLQSTKLRKVIATPGDPLRAYLAGPLGERLFALLAAAARQKREIYAALYELHDPQLEAALAKLGKRAHVVLANGSVKKKGADQNAAARKALREKIDLHDRMTSPRALGHNKFLVICDAKRKPRWVWTGSQNWTMTGLCTQANNAVLLDDPRLAAEYRAQWELLRAAGDTTPASLRQSNGTPRGAAAGKAGTRLWFTPTIGQVDLAEARKLVQGARRAILFLMFNPGPRDSLLSQILATARTGAAGKGLYVRGAINQDPSTTASPVELFDVQRSTKVDFEVVLPAGVDAPTAWFRRELKQLPGTFAMVHSKVVLVDPFGAHPILLTGSHNLGPKASRTNDENLLIVRDRPGVARAYAANIMAIYNQYRWRFRRQVQPAAKRWNGLEDGDGWQRSYLRPGSAARREIDFWIGL